MGTENTARAFWVREPGVGECCPEPLREPGPGELLVRARCSAISRGTESLVFRGEVPDELRDLMRAPFQAGDFPGPVKYGYMSAGEVEEVGPDVDRAWLGRAVFCLHPHQDRYVVPASAVTAVPDGVPIERAVLAANLETAVNGVWDGQPSVGDRIAVVGGGVVGLLVGWLCAQIPGTRVTLVDPQPLRAPIAEALGMAWQPSLSTLDAGTNPTPTPLFDLAFHASGNPAGLEAALGALGPDATLVELSWYGTRPVAVPLGAHFHPRRLRIVSSQVGGIAPERRPRWSYARRLATVMRLLEAPELDQLFTDDSPFDELPAVMAELAQPGAHPGTLCHRIHYPPIL